MREVKSQQDVKPVTLRFFLRQSSNAINDEIGDSPGHFVSVQVRLKSKDLPTLIHDILSSCDLPIQEELEQLVKRQKEKKEEQKPRSIKWSTALRDIMDEDIFFQETSAPIETLYSWLVKNSEAARLRLKEILPITDENRRISRRMIRRHHLANFVTEDFWYSQTALNGALKQMEYLFKRRNVNSSGLHGKTLKLGLFNGLDQLGRFIIDISDVPATWIQGLNSIRDLDGLVHVLDLTEMQISEALRGLKVSRSRTHSPVPIKIYYKYLTQLLQSIRKNNGFQSTSSLIMNSFRARIASAYDDISIDQDGAIVIPCLTTSDAITSFIRLNHVQIIEAKKAHSRSLQQELHSIKSCKDALKLSHLRKDRIITTDQMVKSCERLKRETNLGLENMKLVISNYYGISGDGEIRIPWQWKR